MNILLTGSSGNIGQFLRNYLAKLGHNVIGLSRSSTLPDISANLNTVTDDEITEILVKHDIEIVIHAAGILRPQSMEDILLNSGSILKFFNNDIGKGLKYIVIGSAGEYGISQEEYFLEDKSMTLANSSYGISKLQQSSLCEYYKNKFGINVVVLRLFNIITPTLPTTSFIGAIINAAKEGNKGTIKIKSNIVERDFIDIRDFCDLVNNIVNTKEIKEGIIYNAGSAQNISYGKAIETLNILLEEYKIPLPKVEITNEPEVFSKAKCNITKANQDFHWAPKFAFRDSLEWCLFENKIINKNI